MWKQFSQFVLSESDAICKSCCSSKWDAAVSIASTHLNIEWNASNTAHSIWESDATVWLLMALFEWIKRSIMFIRSRFHRRSILRRVIKI